MFYVLGWHPCKLDSSHAPLQIGYVESWSAYATFRKKNPGLSCCLIESHSKHVVAADKHPT